MDLGARDVGPWSKTSWTTRVKDFSESDPRDFRTNLIFDATQKFLRINISYKYMHGENVPYQGLFKVYMFGGNVPYQGLSTWEMYLTKVSPIMVYLYQQVRCVQDNPL